MINGKSLTENCSATVMLSLSSQVLFNVCKEMTTQGLVEALAKLYEKPSASITIFLIEKIILYGYG